jgi:hypothetical protein
MRIAAALAFGFTVLLAGGSITFAAEDGTPTTHPYHHQHHRYHRLPVVRDATPAPAPATAAAAPAPQTGPFGLAWPHIAPYPDNKGDEDGLSEDDCNKGCIENGPAN